MSKIKLFSASLSIAALMAASPAMADITAQELWALWQEQGMEYGQPVTADVTETASGLTLTNMATEFMIEDDVTLSSHLEEVTLTNRDDGTVEIGTSDTLVYRVQGPSRGGTSAVFATFALTDFGGIASGSTDVLTLDTQLTNLELADLSFENIPASEIPEHEVSLTLAGFSGSYIYDFTTEGFINFSGTGTSGPLAFEMEAREPTNGGSVIDITPTPAPGNNGGGFTPVQPQQPVTPSKQANQAGMAEISFSLGASETTFSGMIPLGIDWTESEVYPAGMAMEVDASYESAAMRFAFRDTYENVDISASNTGGTIGFGLSEQALRYALGAEGVEISIFSQELPFPVSAAADSTLVSVEIPLAQSDTPSPFAAEIAYEGVTVDESLWAMVDPGGRVPRGPATIIMDVSGTVQIFVDLLTMTPDEMENMSSPPGELRDLTLNNLRVSFGGAELTGVGDVDFTPGQVIPVPVGSVNLSLTGANGLLQTLSDAGLVPPQQAGMARGMLGMFAVPGSGPDSYTSAIEFGADGSITANGVPLR